MEEKQLMSFCKELPKLELHAHLNGSLSEATRLALKLLRARTNEQDTQGILDDFKGEKFEFDSVDDCFAVFKTCHDLTDTPAAVKLATTCTIREFYTDGVHYLELRSTPRANEHMTTQEYVDAIISGITEATRYLPIITRLLISIDRREGATKALESVQLAIEVHRRHPTVIAGIDLSGDPSVGHFTDFIEALTMARAAGLQITVHMAEKPTIDEINQIIRFAPERVGHAVCVHAHFGGTAQLWREFLNSKTPVEICLTSNVKSKTVSAYLDHPFKEYYKENHPMSLATDDKGIFDTSLSLEYLHCAQSFKLSRAQLWKLSLDSVSMSFADETTKKWLLDKLLNFKNKYSL